jgi:putative AdoMet-dependent methyltransferase
MTDQWRYDEYTQTGTDFSDTKKVATYDTKMCKFRDYQKEAELIFNVLNVKPEDVLLDIGTGTGHLAIAAAKNCRKVYAIDVSKPMLEYAQQKAAQENITNIEWHNYGFLNFDFPGIKFDHVVSNAVLHHLPDFWKLVALNNVYQVLQDQGKFLLGDVIFSCNITEIPKTINTWLDTVKNVDTELYAEGITHIKAEYSTFSWIIEGMLEKIGFKYKKLLEVNNHSTYLCTKK